MHRSARAGGNVPLLLTPLELLDRRGAVVPPPRVHRHRYFGVRSSIPRRQAKAMSGYCVRVIRPKEYIHARVFDDLAKSVELSLADLSLTGERQIIFGANLLQYFPEPIPDDAILFNLEAPSSVWMTTDYLVLLRRHPTLDYATENVMWLRSRGVDARWCPIRYHRHLTRLTLLEPVVDVLFYGSLEGRRSPILREIERTGVRCKWIGHPEWNERDHWIERSKIVLNLHANDGAPLEMARLSYLLANRAFVISEGPADPLVESGVIFAGAESLPTICNIWARDEEGRRTVAERGFRLFSSMLQADALRDALRP